MKDYSHTRRFTERKGRAAGASLLLLFLLMTMVMGTVIVTNQQIVQGMPHQDKDDGSPARQGSPLIDNYWAKSYGGGGTDYASCVVQTVDGGFVVAGSTTSFGAGGQDVWVLKLDSSGSVVWEKTYGGSGTDYANSIQETSDGGYIVVGSTPSSISGGQDVWVLKLDSSGSVVWSRTYGGALGLNGVDNAYSVEQASDGGYILAGDTTSFSSLRSDVWVLKVDSAGFVVWQYAYGYQLEDNAKSVQQTSDGGYVLAGRTISYGAGLSDFWVLKLSSSGGVAWQKTYGGTGTDYANSIQQTADGGYLVAGYTDSSGAGGQDIWLLKLDSAGSVTWQNTYGGSGVDYASSARQAADGGYLVTGYTNSSGAGGYDVWLLKLDLTGGVAWQKTYGGTGDDYACSVVQTADGGYMVAGSTTSFGAGGQDVWVVRLGVDGEIVWDESSGASTHTTGVIAAGSSVVPSATPVTPRATALRLTGLGVTPRVTYATVISQATAGLTIPYWAKTYGGSGTDYASSVVQTADGGYMVAGYTNSCGAGRYDVWLLKLGSMGGVTWQKTYGGASDDYACSIQQTADGGYIVAGYTNSSGAGGYDVWLLKLDSMGGVTWQKTYGGTGSDIASSVVQTADGGFVVAGSTTSFGAGGQDYWVLKLNSTGGVTWQKTYGGTSSNDAATSVKQTSDGGYVVTGGAGLAGIGYSDVWVLKLDSAGSVMWQKAYGAYRSDSASSVQQTSDGGYVLAGRTNSFGEGGWDIWLSKIDSVGGVTWTKSLGGGSGWEYAYSVVQTPDGGYIVAGTTSSFGAGDWDFWVLELDSIAWETRQRTYGGSGTDSAYYVEQTSDGGIIIAGTTTSFGAGGQDIWIVKLGVDGDIVWDAGSGASTYTTGSLPREYGVTVVNTRAIVNSYVATVEDSQVTPYDTDATVMIQSPPPAPTIDQPDDITYDIGQTGNSITWHPSSQMPNKYSITRGGTIIASGSWSGTPITQIVDGLSLGAYVYTCTINDTLGRSASSSVQVLVLPPAPTIDQPLDIVYTVGETGRAITWHPSSQIPDHYTIAIDGGSPTSYSWNGEVVIYSVDGLSVGTYSYNCTVYDTQGRVASSEVHVTVLPPAPTIDQPSAVTYYVGETGNSITWTPSSEIPDHYTISVDGGSPMSYGWGGEVITYDVDGLLSGTYTYNCTVYDTQGRKASSVVQVTVLPLGPTIDQPSDVTYTVGETGNSITWNPNSQTPDHYTIAIDGGSPTSYSWDGETITFSVDGLSVGTHTYNCTVYDTSARKASSLVHVTVLPLAPTIDQPGTVMYIVGRTGNNITWTPSSQVPDYYVISVDGGSPASYSWDGSPITVSVDGLSAGTYDYNCSVYDVYGRHASSVVQVTVLPLAPTIDQLSNITYVVGQTGNVITWTPSSQIPDYYMISVDAGSPTSYSWDGQAIAYNVDGLLVGTYTYNCTVYDTLGRKATSVVQVTVLPLAPTIDQPSVITYTVGETGNSITWHPSSSIPYNYTIFVNGGSPASYSWDGSPITVSVDGLSAGTYTYNCTVYDTLGRKTSSVVQVIVLPLAPTIDQPDDVAYTVGETGRSITWTPSSEVPHHYTISVNSGSPVSYSWDGSTINYSVDGLSAGTYSITCTVYDIHGRSVSSTVTVTVTEPTAGEGLPIPILVGAAAAVAMIAVISVVIIMKRRK